MKKWLIPAAVLAVAGMAALFTPVRFTGFLLLCAAGVLAVLGALRNKKAARRVVLVCIVLGLMAFTIAEAQVIIHSKTDNESRPDAMIVLGAGVYGTQPSLSLLVRLEAALCYAEAHPNIPVVVSGGQGPGEDISEARCMADWLGKNGLDNRRIILEDRSTSTSENLAYSSELLRQHGVDPDGNIAVVSSDYHLYRASRIWGKPGFIPVAAHMDGRWWPLTVNYYIREAFGTVYIRLFG